MKWCHHCTEAAIAIFPVFLFVTLFSDKDQPVVINQQQVIYFNDLMIDVPSALCVELDSDAEVAQMT